MGNCVSCLQRNNSVDSGREDVQDIMKLEEGREDVQDITKLDAVKDRLQAINDPGKIDELLGILRQILQRKALAKSGQDEAESSSQADLCNDFIHSGETILGFLNDHIDKSSSEGDFVSFAPEIIGRVLERLGNVHWVVGGLSVIGYLLQKATRMSGNYDKCIETLQKMVDLSEHVKKLDYSLQHEEEKLKKATLIIVEGCIICVSQLHSQPFFRFLQTSVDGKALDSLQKNIHELYSDLTLTTVEQQTVHYPKVQPSYPRQTVGLKRPQHEIIELLDLESKYAPLLAVVIYGFGGIGKTTLAEAVVAAAIDLEHYSYCRVDLHEDFSDMHIKRMQEKILNEAFPTYTMGIRTKLESSTSEGRTVLTLAFKTKGNNPVFLFIDNVLRKEDLSELLPGDLRGLPQGSRILVTTRDLGATHMLTEYEGGLKRRAYLVDPLPPEEAKDFLLQDSANSHIRERDVERILKICKGVPLVLKIVRGHFRKQGYSAWKCSQIIEALEKGTDVKQEGLSKHLTDFVYDQFEESTQQAFLDICCFFSGWNRDQVECIVGAQELTSLEEAAFVQRSHEELIVHDIIRERGRNKSKHTRIMDVESLTHAVANEQVLEDIRGVWLFNEDESEYVLKEQHLKAMRNLRVLALEGRIRVNGLNHLTFEELRFIQVRRAFIPFLPLNIKGLPKLAFYEGPLFKEDISMYKSPKELEVMKAGSQSDLKECPVLEESMPIAAAQISFLKETDFTELKNLEKLPDRLHHLIELKMLKLSGWHKKVELPENICRLRSLKYLCLEGWTSLQCLPESFGQLRGLEHLNLSDWESLQYLPKSICELSALKHLDLTRCLDLQSLPESFGQLAALTNLSLDVCKSLNRLPSTFVHLKALKFVGVSICPAQAELRQISASFEQLEIWDIFKAIEETLRVTLPGSLPSVNNDAQHPSENNAAQRRSSKIRQVSICNLCNHASTYGVERLRKL